ncbi:unnamed protein product, partial [Musa textilis]
RCWESFPEGLDGLLLAWHPGWDVAEVYDLSALRPRQKGRVIRSRRDVGSGGLRPRYVAQVGKPRRGVGLG